jgi:hypothetical protein
VGIDSTLPASLPNVPGVEAIQVILPIDDVDIFRREEDVVNHDSTTQTTRQTFRNPEDIGHLDSLAIPDLSREAAAIAKAHLVHRRLCCEHVEQRAADSYPRAPESGVFTQVQLFRCPAIVTLHKHTDLA